MMVLLVLIPVSYVDNACNNAEKTHMRVEKLHRASHPYPSTPDHNPRHLSRYAQRVLHAGIMESNTSLINKPALMYAREIHD